MIRLFLDTSVPLYAVGGPSKHRAACQRIVRYAHAGEARLHLSVEGGQEFLFHRLRRGSRAEAITAFDLLDEMVEWHNFDVSVLRESRRIVAAGEARGRDAVHAATALLAGFDSIISVDSDFDAINGLRRVPPQAVDLS